VAGRDIRIIIKNRAKGARAAFRFLDELEVAGEIDFLYSVPNTPVTGFTTLCY